MARASLLAVASAAPALAVLVVAGAAAAPPAAWSGTASCTITVTGPGYRHTETQRWRLGGASTVSGAFRIVPARWTDTGSGSSGVTQGDTTRRADWQVSAQAAGSFRIAVRASDGKLAIRQGNAQIRVKNGITGTQRLTVAGVERSASPLGLEAFEASLPPVVVGADSSSITGSTTATGLPGSFGPLQPAGSSVSRQCSWRLVQAP